MKTLWPSRDRALAIDPDDVGTKVSRAFLELNWKADTRRLHQTIDSIREKNPAAVQGAAYWWWICALAERDAAAAANALEVIGENFNYDAIQFSRAFLEGLLARMTKDDAKARSAFAAARTQQEKVVQAQPNYAPAVCVLGVIDAGLGRKEDALRAVTGYPQLWPIETTTLLGPAPRRSALRKNRRLSRAERNGFRVRTTDLSGARVPGAKSNGRLACWFWRLAETIFSLRSASLRPATPKPSGGGGLRFNASTPKAFASRRFNDFLQLST